MKRRHCFSNYQYWRWSATASTIQNGNACCVYDLLYMELSSANWNKNHRWHLNFWSCSVSGGINLLNLWCTLFLFYKKPTTWRVGSTFLWKPRFKAQKFLKLMKISGFCFLTFYHFQPQSFLRCLKFEPEVSCDIKNLSLNFLKYSWLHYQAIEIT